MDLRLREIISKQAGVYFVVTKKSQVAEIEATSKMRLFFTNVRQAPVNSLVKFAKGDTDGYTSVFGKESRAMVKGGNFSHQVCLDALASGPIAVINLRHFDDDRDITDVGTINPNTVLLNGIKGSKVPYTSLFDTSSFWIPKTDKVSEHYQENGFLNFANIGSNDFSLIVVKSTPEEVALLTSEGNKTLENTQLEIDDLPGLNFTMMLKDTFVTIYLFSKVLSQNNPSYAHLFDANGRIPYGKLSELTQISASGYYTKYVGSVIPNLVSEKSTNLSIDKIVYNDYMQSGLIVDINQEMLESSLEDLGTKNGMVDLFGIDGNANSTSLLSYKIPASEINATAIKFVPAIPEENVIPSVTDTQTGIKYETEKISITSFKGTGSQGLKIGDNLIGMNGIATIESMTKLDTQTKNGTTVMKYDYVGFAYGNGKYIGVSNDKDLSGRNYKWVQSYDKENWTSLYMNISDLGLTPNAVFTHVLYGSSFAVFAFDATLNKNFMLRYDTGVWRCTEIISSEQIKKVVYGAGRYIALSDTKIFVIKNTSVDIYDNTESLIDLCYYAYSTGSNFFGLSVGKIIKSSNGESGTWTTIKTNTVETVRYKHISNNSDNLCVLVQTIADSKFESLIKSANNGADWTESILTTPIETVKSVVGMTDLVYILSNDYSLVSSDLTVATTAVVLDESYVGVNINKCGSELVVSCNDSETENITFIGETTEINNMSENFTMNIDIYEIKCNNEVNFETSGEKTHITKMLPYVYNANTPCNIYTFESYVPVEDQFTNGTSSRQSQILDMMNNPGIVKGISSTKGIRYIVDCFKSFVEPSYKHQFGLLLKSLESKNVFANAIINEPFVSDLIKSTNPLFKNNPSSPLNLEYLPEGGNKDYSQILLNKFTEGAELCYFYGPENIVRDVPKSLNGRISNLFYTKTLPFDIIANTTGYLTVDELGYKFDDDERKFLENFNYNPIIDLDGTTIFGNRDGAGGQIHQAELLSYIKSSLYNMAKKESFTKGTYDDYNRTETEITDFMDSLALANAIKANPVVQCNLENNTEEISKNKIKLIHIEYTPIDGLEKVVFDLNVN